MNIIKNFYNLLPFNKAPDSGILSRIEQPGSPWPQLDALLDEADTVLELGCGNGWLSNRIANNWANTSVTGIDLIDSNIETAKRLSRKNSRFYSEDLTHFSRTADLVISVGVLHHVPDADLTSLISKAVLSSKKSAFIGLYHQQSRQAMFDFFHSYPEKSRYKLFKKMTPWFSDEQQRMSWWRDQFQHPYEVSATIEHYQAAARNTGRSLIWTSESSDDVYHSTMSRLQHYEFTSGFIYGVFKNDQLY